jgi:ribonuclease-3
MPNMNGQRDIPLSDSDHLKNIQIVEDIVGYTFKDKGLIEAALTHPSAAQHTAHSFNYERLEFLGDSILGAVVASDLFVRYPDLDEGGLTRIKVALVSGATLSKVAYEAGIGDAIIFGESESGTDRRGFHSALENVFEAIVAALFLDGGIEVARTWILKALGPYVSKDIAMEPESPKSSLQEYLQARQKSPVYEITGSDGPPHDRTFFARVLVDGEVEGEGKGRSKKEAEAAAAKVALQKFGV